MNDLTFHRLDGIYRAEADLGGERANFVATIVRQGPGSWWLDTFTYGRQLHSQECATLADARAEASSTYRTVNL